MNKIKTSADIDHLRRRFFGAIAMTFAAARFGMIGSANAQAIKASAKELPVVKPGTHTSFGPLKQIDAGLLNVGYAEAGPADGPPIILLHGWPYDIYSFVDVAPLLAAAGYRVIVPYVRGTNPRVTFCRISMAEFAAYLSQSAGLPVIDQTGLSGLYDFSISKLEPTGNSSQDPSPPTIWDISELGLKLKAIKFPLETIVIDHIERPSEN